MVQLAEQPSLQSLCTIVRVNFDKVGCRFELSLVCKPQWGQRIFEKRIRTSILIQYRESFTFYFLSTRTRLYDRELIPLRDHPRNS